MRLKGKKVLVVGLGKSGVAATRFLQSQGARVAVTDSGTPAERESEWAHLEHYWGGHPAAIFDRRDLIVVSPGVSLSQVGFRLARRRRIPVIGELGLAAEFIKAPIVAVTGTNGKSTTSTLIWEILRSGGQQVALAGNIGKPLLEVVMEGKKYDRVVVEVSSFQLETVKRFRPEVAVLLNVTPDHLDRYARFQDYLKAKMRILKDQSVRDWVVYNYEDRLMRPSLGRARAKKIPFTISRLLTSGVFFSGGRIVRRWKGMFEEYPLAGVKLVGRHNIENMMAAIAVARVCDVLPDAIRQALQRFEGLPHRMQLLRETNGVKYYDDSKGTNVDAVVQSIAGFDDHRVILIAGGREKGSSFTPLRESVSKKVKLLLLIGEAGTRIAKSLKDCCEIREVGTLEKAVEVASSEARTGDIVLLSPACASFDQFKNYEDRGQRFKELVERYAQAV